MRALFVISAVLQTFSYFPSVLSQDANDMRNMPKYDVRYDYLDIDAILDSKRLVRNYVDCLINSVRCTPEGKALKRILPEALRSKCARCTERQKRTAVKVIRRLKYEYPEEWGKLSGKWDPTGDFTRFFEDYLAKEVFNTIPNTGNEIADSLPPCPSTPPPTLRPLPPRMTTPSPPPSPPQPAVLNRFDDDGVLMQGGSASPSFAPAPAPTAPAPPPALPSRPTIQNRPTTWTTLMVETLPTRFPLRPVDEMPPPYSTAITLIDQIGYKIIRTTELVTDILRNTVRAVVG
uniref:Putative chemosensory protein 9 n=1 Tax=Conopomorpha sinensis TaxID=940481 RepID=A0A649ZUP6_9NEOP|nr:putative chemosensory protein 9 [Conopomorpha sinensis]